MTQAASRAVAVLTTERVNKLMVEQVSRLWKRVQKLEKQMRKLMRKP